MTNVFRTPGALLPSTCLSPFVASPTINDSFYPFSDSCSPWSAMTSPLNHPMNHRMLPVAEQHFSPLSPNISRQAFMGSTFPTSTCGNMALANAVPLSTGNSYNDSVSPIIGSTCASNMYSPSSTFIHSTSYPCMINRNCDTPNNISQSCGIQDIGDIWRGSSIATLRKKALEHTASSGVVGFR